MRILAVGTELDYRQEVESRLDTIGLPVEIQQCSGTGIAEHCTQDSDLILINQTSSMTELLAQLSQIRGTSLAPVMVVIETGNREIGVKALHAGADDFLENSVDLSELVARVIAIDRRIKNTRYKPPVRDPFDPQFFPKRNYVAVQAQKIKLTHSESKILRLLSDSMGKPVSREHLERVVFKRDYNPLNRSLDTHISNMRKKLDLDQFGSKRITAVRGFGYQLGP